MREVCALCRMRHPHVVAFFGTTQIGGLSAIVLEYVPPLHYTTLPYPTLPYPTPLLYLPPVERS